MSLRLVLALGLLLGALAGPAAAEQYALLVGVSAYPTLAPQRQLKGPRQDVLGLRQALLQRGFEAQRIQVLADGVDGAALPTHAAILAALATLARQAQPGDRVVLLFAGHGSQQPTDGSVAAARDEPDGLNETFLPRDVGRWDGERGTVANALTDTTLRESIDRISDRGAFVWALFDACHSATLVRGGDEASGLRLRQVQPGDLGIGDKLLARHRPGTGRPGVLPATTAATTAAMTAAMTAATTAAAIAANPRPSQRAPAVYFYAAQSTDAAVELPLPLGLKGAPTQGLFSFAVARALASGQPMTYRQLFQHVLYQYNDVLQARSTPLYAGDGLDQPVLGQRAPVHRQWPLENTRDGLRVPAGSLDGLSVGARFALLADPLAPGPVRWANGSLAELVAVAVEAGQSALAVQPPAGAALPRGAWVRLLSNPPAYTLRVAEDLSACPADCGPRSLPHEALRAALARLRRDGVPGVAAQWVAAADSPDVTLRVLPRALHYRLIGDALADSLSDAGAQLPTVGITLPPSGDPQAAAAALVRQIGDELHALARERNLLRLAAMLPPRNPITDLAATLTLHPAQNRGQPPSVPQTLSAEQSPLLRPGDGLSLRLRNLGPGAVDATLLLLDAEHGITVLYPRDPAESNRLEAGAATEIPDLSIEARSTGLERLVVLWVPARTQREARNFSLLQQPPLSRTRGATDPALQALLDACFADHQTRGGVPAWPADGLGMRVFTVRIRP